MKIQFIYRLIIIYILCSSCTPPTFELQEGDLLFQQWTESDFAKAINKVTFGYENHDFAHIGMVISQNHELKVFEATQSKGVSLTSVDSFLYSSVDEFGNPLVAVGRIKKHLENEIPIINDWVLNQLSKPYDTLFIYGNEKYYCSELIHDAFNLNAKEHIFTLAPMTFIDPDTKNFFPIWIDYFKNLNADIPEGELGINPGLMSRSPNIDIVHEYFKN